MRAKAFGRLLLKRLRALGGGLGPGGRDPWRLAGRFGKVRRPRRIREPIAFIPGSQVQQRVQRAGMLLHRRVGVAFRREPCRHRQHREVPRLRRRNLLPAQRRRHPRIGQRTHAVGRGGRAVLGILVVVEKDAVPLLFPPLGGGQLRGAALHGPRQRQCRATNLREAPARLDPHVDVHAARAAGLGPAGQPVLLEHGLDLHRRPPDVVPADARPGVEIHPQLIRVVQVRGPHGVRMQLDAAEVDDPGQPRRIVNHDLLRRTARGKRECHRAQPRGPVLRRTLLVERLLVRTIHEALQDDRPVAYPEQRAGRHGQVVAHDVDLAQLHLAREVQLVRVRHAYRVAVDVEDLGIILLAHRVQPTAKRRRLKESRIYVVSFANLISAAQPGRLAQKPPELIPCRHGELVFETDHR